jgi:hypothetical protein
MSKHCLLRLLTVLLAVGAMSTASSAVSPEDKMRHYCTNWGAAGLFADDKATVTADPMAAMSLDLGGGNILRVKYLFIEKGYLLENQPAQWAEIWTGFTKACPGWQRPAWVQKLQAWKKTKSDPLAARRTARIRQIEGTIRSGEAELAQLLRRIQGSPGYMEITGGAEDWHARANQKATYLGQIAGLSETTYTVVGRVESQQQSGVFVVGVAIAPKKTKAPGAATAAARLFVLTPGPSWIRSNQDFFAQDLHLQRLPDANNPQLVFASKLTKEDQAKVSTAKSELRKIKKVLKSGRRKLAKMMRPVKRAEGSLASLRAELAKLQGEAAKR